MSSDVPPQTPEGRLIEAATAAKNMSIRQLSAAADISDGRWRQIVKGYQPLGGGRFNPVVAPAATLARMAWVLDLAPEDLEQVGRADASPLLAELRREGQRRPQRATPVSSRADMPDEIDMIYASTTMTAQQKLEAIRMVLHLRQQAEKEASSVDETSSNAHNEHANNGA